MRSVQITKNATSVPDGQSASASSASSAPSAKFAMQFVPDVLLKQFLFLLVLGNLSIFLWLSILIISQNLCMCVSAMSFMVHCFEMGCVHWVAWVGFCLRELFYRLDQVDVHRVLFMLNVEDL